MKKPHKRVMTMKRAYQALKTPSEKNEYGVEPHFSSEEIQGELVLIIKNKLMKGTREDQWNTSLNSCTRWSVDSIGKPSLDFTSEYVILIAEDVWWVIKPEKVDELLARCNLMDRLRELSYAGEYHLIKMETLLDLFGRVREGVGHGDSDQSETSS